MPKRRGRQTGSVLPHKKGFRAAYCLTKDGKRLRGSKVCPTKGEAEAWLRKQLDQGPTGSGTLSEWLDRWEAIQRAETEPGTHVRDFGVVRREIRPFLGPVKLSSLTANRINAWLADLKAAAKSDDARWRACGGRFARSSGPTTRSRGPTWSG